MPRGLQPGVDKIGEDWVKEKVKAILKAKNIQFFMPSASQYGKAGAADFICCYHGYYVAIEAKAGKGKQSDLQKKYQADVTKAGGVYYLINEHNYKDLETYLQ